MTEAPTVPVPDPDAAVPGGRSDRPLTPVEQAALREAEARRAGLVSAPSEVEHGGPRGPEPTRYGDWEKRGLAVDF